MRDNHGPSEKTRFRADRGTTSGFGPTATTTPLIGRLESSAFAQQSKTKTGVAMKSEIFGGLSAFPLTPADENGRIDTEDYAYLLNRLIEAKVDSITTLGSTGIYIYLSRSERRRAVETAVHAAAGRIPVMAGIGALRTSDAVDFARDAQAAGANALLMAPVTYFALSEEEVYQHFLTVAKSTDLPICIYNNPSTTHFTVSPKLVERLAKIPSIVALKNPLAAGNDFRKELEELRPRVPGHFSIGYSGDSGCMKAMLEGADAFYSAMAGTIPKPFLMLVRAAQAGNESEAARINEHFQPLWNVSKELSGIRVTYAIADILKLSRAKPPRPLLSISASDYQRVSQALDTLAKLGNVL